MEETIPLRVGNDSGAQPILERIPARRLSSSRFQLIRSPGLVEGLAAGDEIEVVDQNRFVVKQRGGNVCVWVYFERELEPVGTADLREEVESLGGYLDGGTHASLIFTIPASAGLKRIESVFERLVDPTAGVTWMFGNVYDPVDGRTPLGWWDSAQREG